MSGEEKTCAPEGRSQEKSILDFIRDEGNRQRIRDFISGHPDIRNEATLLDIAGNDDKEALTKLFGGEVFGLNFRNSLILANAIVAFRGTVTSSFVLFPALNSFLQLSRSRSRYEKKKNSSYSDKEKVAHLLRVCQYFDKS